MATALKLPYGLRDGQLLHISEVANGLGCACTCPGCGARLVARNQGQRKVAHFAHHQAPECPYGLQTAIHLAAKEVFLKYHAFCLPGAAGHFDFTPDYWASFDFDASFYEGCVPGTIHVADEYDYPKLYVAVYDVLLERKTEDIIPDIILCTENGPLLVEIAVTHFIDDKKHEKLKRLGIPTIEIDLSKVARDLALPELEDLLIHQTAHKRWAYNAKLDAKIDAHRQRYFEAMRPYFEEEHAEYSREEKENKERQARQEAYKLYERQEAENKRLKREQREIFYETQRKPIFSVKSPDYGRISQVFDCPDPRRAYEGQPYSLVEQDCRGCWYFRGGDREHESIICLYEYYNRHKIRT
jgi:hypothetical protein